MSEGYTFVIYAPSYSPDVGGGIVLHKLCDTLNRLGYRALIWPREWRPKRKQFNIFKWPKRWIKKKLRNRNDHNDFRLNPNFLAPLATRSDIANSIVVYPETVSGNPLNAQRVVRWLLYKPGFHTGEIKYGDEDLFFYFNEVFNDPAYNKTPGNQLHVTHILTDIYKQTNFGERSGGCYIVRKGKDRDLNYHPANYQQIDGLSHEDICKVFNQSEFFISYDLHTLYSQYAVLCGCKSIVVPDPALSKADVYPIESNCYAIAYGMEEIDQMFTENQISKLKASIDAQQKLTIDSVANFAKVAIGFFAARAKR